jgi:aldose sugar dehydrogenase
MPVMMPVKLSSAVDRLLRPRGLLLAAALGAAVGGSFLTGLYLGSEFGIRALKDYASAVIDPSSRPQAPAGAWKTVPTLLHDVVIERLPLPPTRRTGGAIGRVGSKLLFATPEGHLGYLTAEGTLHLMGVRVPMNEEALREHPIAGHPRFDIQYIRVNGMLALDAGPSRHRILVSHHHYGDGCVDFRVSALTVEVREGGLEPLTADMAPVFIAEPCIGFRRDAKIPFSGHQAGGRMVPFADGRVLLSIGDHQFDGTHGMPEPMPPGMPEERAFPMDPRVSLGKVLLLDPRTGEAEIFATGMRNPQGLLRDIEGRVWQTEHGPRGGDELNLIERGGNYGWPEVSLGIDYDGGPWPFNTAQGRHDGYIEPRFAWVPAIGVSNLVQARGGHFPLWEGDLLVTSLLRMTVFRLRTRGDRVVYSEPMEIGERIRDIAVLEDGRIALYADSANAILILRNGSGAGSTRSTGDPAPDTIVWRGEVELADSEGALVYQASCAACHSLRGDNEIGPPLDGVMGRAVGRAEGFAYSAALREAKASWTRRHMAAYVRDPQSAYPGTHMTAVRLSDPEIEALLTFLEAQQPGSQGRPPIHRARAVAR